MEKFDMRQLIGEATEYDKKQTLEVKKPKSWCKSVSAFANGMGGRLIWGISDDDTLIGLADAKGDAEKISEAIKAHIDPIPDFKLSLPDVKTKSLWCSMFCLVIRLHTTILAMDKCKPLCVWETKA